jgi:hypothetical protein
MLPEMGDGGMKRLMCGMALLAAVTATAGLTTTSAAGERVVEQSPPGIEQFSYSRIPLPPLPRRHQNHCGWIDGHYICADHCGTDYQVYYCPTSASGCCHIGLGYCDAGGRLRCAPNRFDALLRP